MSKANRWFRKLRRMILACLAEIYSTLFEFSLNRSTGQFPLPVKALPLVLLICFPTSVLASRSERGLTCTRFVLVNARASVSNHNDAVSKSADALNPNLRPRGHLAGPRGSGCGTHPPLELDDYDNADLSGTTGNDEA